MGDEKLDAERPPIAEAMDLVSRIAQELGLLADGENAVKAFYKIEGATTKQKIYIQRSKRLGRIDSTLERTLPDGTEAPGVIPLSAHNGKIRYHVQPTLRMLELHLRRLADPAEGSQDTKRARPFMPAPPRKPEVPKARSMPIDVPSVPDVIRDEKSARIPLKDRLDAIAERARLARIRRVLENPQIHGNLTREEAADLVDGKVTQDELDQRYQQGEIHAVQELAVHSGIEFE